MATVRVTGYLYSLNYDTGNTVFGIPETIQIGDTTRELNGWMENLIGHQYKWVEDSAEGDTPIPEGGYVSTHPEVWEGEINASETEIGEIQILGWSGIDEGGGILDNALVIHHAGIDYQLENL